MTLDKLKTGESAVIKAVGGEGALRLRFLDMGLIPKTKVKMLKRAPMGDPLDIVLRGYELTLRIEDDKNIEIEKQRRMTIYEICPCRKSELRKDHAF